MSLTEHEGGKSFKRVDVNNELSIPHYSQISNLPSGLDEQYAIAIVDDVDELYYTEDNGSTWNKVNKSKEIIGIEWNITQDTWKQIDEDGNKITLTSSEFNSIQPWVGMNRVNLSDAGEINNYYGESSYKEDGTNGRVMVSIPKFFVKAEKTVESGDTIVRKWVSNYNAAGFEVHPAFNQRTNNPPAEQIFIGAYQGDFVYDASNTQYEIHSRASKQPWTGGQIWEVDFDGGTNEPSIGDDVGVTGTDDNWFVVDYNVTSGGWATNDAAGKIWIRKPGDDSLGWTDDDTITNNTQSNTLAVCEFTGGAKTALHFDIEEAQTYSSNIGTGWGLENIWSFWAVQLLFNIEYGNMDSQTELGKGIVDKAGGTGFNGELTAVDSINSNLNSALTGTGTGTDGLTPIAYRGIENPWGNVWTFVDGYEAVDAEYRILIPQGGWSNSGPSSWTSSDYQTSTATPLNDGGGDSDGYISDIEKEELLKYGYIGSATAGSNSEYIPDKFWIHDNGENNILRAGGGWWDGSDAGVGCLYSPHDVGDSHQNAGARLEFIQ